jgi:prephenate dehydratase
MTGRAATGQQTAALPAAKCAYLGPRGTFCEQAVTALHGGSEFEPVPYPTIAAALDAVRTGVAQRAVVPIESSVEGGVNATLDELASGLPLVIKAEVLVPVEFALLVRPGTTLADIKVVGGHPVAQPQCRRWLADHLPDAQWRPALSNADAAWQVADGELDAALAGRFAAAHYQLEELVTGVHDRAGAVTRFSEVGRPGPLAEPTVSDRTSVIAFLADDHPGALMDILSQFAMRGVNLTRIESRPTGEGIGRYCFFIDCEGHVFRPNVGEALMGLRRVCSDVRFLGSYATAWQPADAGQPPPQTQPGTEPATAAADARYTAAAQWLDQIRAGRSLPAHPTGAFTS